MLGVLFVCFVAPQIEGPASGSGLIRQDFDLLVPEPAEQTRQAIAFRLDALQTARLARLDQLLALTGVQRRQLAERLRQDAKRPFGGSALQVGPLLKSERLKPLLTSRQLAVFNRWREEGSLAWYARKARGGAARIESDVTDAALLIVDRLATELKCSAAQQRRLRIAARGVAPRFRRFFETEYAALGELQPPLTTEFLLRDGTLVPLVGEVPFWQRTLETTLSSQQRAAERELSKERLEFYRRANALGTTADLQVGLPLTAAETQRFSALMLDRFELKRPVYPLREATHPVLLLQRSDLQDILPPARIEEFLELTKQAQSSVTNRKPADRKDREPE